jgi:hypothetical protein
MRREEILKAAAERACEKHEQDYGSPAYNFANIARLWEQYLSAVHHVVVTITVKDVAMMMALLKIARIAVSNTPASFVDLAGYAACAGEICTEGGSRK